MSRGRLVAILRRRGRFWIAEPVFSPKQADSSGTRPASTIQLGSSLPARSARAYREGDLVVLTLPARGHGRPRRAARGASGGPRIERTIGSPDVAANAIEALLVDRGLARAFDPELDREAQRLSERQHQLANGQRRDLRALPTLTIDPASARDFDDAISAQRLSSPEAGSPDPGSPDPGSPDLGSPDPSAPEPGSPAEAPTIRVWVHIADVCAYLPAGSPLDREARLRSTSIYAPGTVEPMLPQALSCDACSLLPGQDRLAVTVELDLDGPRVLRSSVYRSLIRSDVRLDYDGVDRIFAGREQAPGSWRPTLEAARAAAHALGEHRRRRARALVVEALEPEFSLDEQGHIRELSLRSQTESHELIEHLMIAANETVAQLLAARRAPCLYRVHATPDPAKVRRLVDQFASLSVPTPALPEQLTSSQAAELIGEISASLERYLQSAAARRERGASDGPPPSGRLALTSLLLRALPQAHYSPVNIGHSGLGSSCYCHFTSPIRRYPDVICHRALLAAIDGTEPAPLARELPELGERASEREREAMRIERDADDMARCFALEQLLYEQGFDQIFTGEVTGLISAGAFIAFGPPSAPPAASASPPRIASGSPGPSGAKPAGLAHPGESVFEGMLPVRLLRSPSGERDWWELNEQSTILSGEFSRTSIRLGDQSTVRVARVEKLRGRVDLRPAGES